MCRGMQASANPKTSLLQQQLCQYCSVSQLTDMKGPSKQKTISFLKSTGAWPGALLASMLKGHWNTFLGTWETCWNQCDAFQRIYSWRNGMFTFPIPRQLIDSSRWYSADSSALPIVPSFRGALKVTYRGWHLTKVLENGKGVVTGKVGQDRHVCMAFRSRVISWLWTMAQRLQSMGSHAGCNDMAEVIKKRVPRKPHGRASNLSCKIVGYLLLCSGIIYGPMFTAALFRDWECFLAMFEKRFSAPFIEVVSFLKNIEEINQPLSIYSKWRLS